MAIINKITGYYGFTYNTPLNNIIEDQNGQVNKVIFSIVYPLQNTDVNFTISDGADDWAAQMGDGEIIPLSDPVVLFQNRDSSVVEFTMESVYPSNSPCVLVYRSDSAKFNITAIDEVRDFVGNSVSGHFAFTVEGYGGTMDENGQVNRVVASIAYPLQTTDVDFTISDDPSHWGARMGDGTIIPLRDPIVLNSNRDNAVVQFTMDEMYPSNSPCILVYRSEGASYNIKVREAETVFTPVQDITDVPDEVITGTTIDLSAITIKPYNASNQGITWSVVSGNAVVSGNRFVATAGGTIVIRATISGGGEDESDFTKDFTIKAEATIEIINQPSSVTVTKGSITESMSVVASITGGTLKYQWYQNETNNNEGGTKIDGATSSTMKLSTSLSEGQYYYYCEISDMAETAFVKSSVAVALVVVRVDGISITPSESKIGIGGTLQLVATISPSDATNHNITWESSNTKIASVDQTGLVTSKGTGGDVTITAKTEDGGLKASATLHATSYVPITSISGIPELMKVGDAITLAPVIEPEDATYTNIQWSIRNDLNTGAYFDEDGSTLHVPELGDRAILIRATVNDGRDLGIAYVQEYRINIELSHVPVEDIYDLPEKGRAGTPLLLSGVVSPSNATYKTITWRVKYQGGTNSSIDTIYLNSQNTGTVTLEARIKNGIASGEDYVEEFEVDVRGEFVAVEDLEDLPTSIYINEDQELTATVVPSDATNKDIEWEIVDAGSTKATLSGNVINATRTGTMKLRASIYCGLADGEFVNGVVQYVDPYSEGAQNDPFTKEFIATVKRFIAVTNITNVPTALLLTEGSLNLTGTVVPSNATNQTITWSVVKANGTGATVHNGVLVANKVGTATIRATIVNGKSETGMNKNFTKDFEIEIQEGVIEVTDIVDVPTNAYYDVELELTGTVVPNHATNKQIVWTIADDEEDATIEDGNIFICPIRDEDSVVRVKATVVNGTNEGDFEKIFEIAVSVATKGTQDAPAEFDLTFSQDDDGTFTATIPIIENGEYSFNVGTSWSDVNTLSNIGYNVTITAMARYKETDENYASLATTCVATSPMDTVSDPVFDPDGSEPFEDSVTVTITTSTDGATIYYTTDGEDPRGSHGVEYTEPITITETTQINAYALKDGMNPSNVVTVDYEK